MISHFTMNYNLQESYAEICIKSKSCWEYQRHVIWLQIFVLQPCLLQIVIYVKNLFVHLNQKKDLRFEVINTLFMKHHCLCFVLEAMKRNYYDSVKIDFNLQNAVIQTLYRIGYILKSLVKLIIIRKIRSVCKEASR